MWDLLLWIGPSLGVTIGYFGRRWIEKAWHSEKIDRTAKLLDIKERMEATGLTPDDLAQFEENLLNRRPRLRRLEDAIQIEIQNDDEGHSRRYSTQPDDNGEFQTQAEMNEAANAALEKAKVLLAETVEALHADLSDEESERLAKMQKTWAAYADDQALLSASRVKGGSMFPMMYAAEAERLTVQRIAELKEILEFDR